MIGSGDSEHEEVAELLGAYALDALEPGEAVRVQAHLEECPRCSTEVARHHEVAGLLANSGAAAPAELWDRIAERLDSPDNPVVSDTPDWEKLAVRLDRPPGIPGVLADQSDQQALAGSASGGAVVPMDQSRRRSRRVTRAVTLVATAAAVLALLLGVQVAHLNSRVGQLQSASSQPGLSRAVQTALEQPSTKRVKLVPSGGPSAGGPTVTVALTTSGTAYLIPQDLSALPSAKTYQLWGEIDGRMISLGLLGPHPAVSAFSVNPTAPVSVFAITAERSGGVLQPTHAPVVQGAVTA